VIELRPLSPEFGAEIVGFEPRFPLDEATIALLRDAFDERGLLVFRDLDIDFADQVYLSKLLIRKEDEPDDAPDRPPITDNWYISNREGSAVPPGRLQFHADGMWADEPFEMISLYGAEIGQPAVPTTFVSAVAAWRTLPDDLRAQAEGLEVLHTAGAVRRGDVTDVIVSTVDRPREAVKPLGLTHPRTGATVLYACEQMTQEVVGLDPETGERLLEELFEHLYDPAVRFDHHWRTHDLVVWDNIAVQHARPNLAADGPERTLRKVGWPMPRLEPDQVPTYSSAS
jgi:alpha-ketoglutarate-dependent taurine dioxygenase